ncbi:MAG: hypothetical protein PHT69_07775 [Bacteroidales bacterium]|nr:hypothetical protein [Bacteroidales bacterium]
MKKTKPQATDKVSEPLVSYQHSDGQLIGRDIIISSPEVQEEANYLYWLSLTPRQRLELHYKMASVFWQDALLKKKINRKIIIK